MLIRAPELATQSATTPWIIEPYFPREGIVLLYGKKGVGKSPLTWALAEACATGSEWLVPHLPVKEVGPVLYIEADTPRLVVSQRMGQVLSSPDVHIYFPPGSIADADGWRRLQHETEAVTPSLVIINTLRKVHAQKDTDSNIPNLVYTRFRTQWPHACLVFVHHEKKTPANPDHEFTEGEEFSGSLAWANDAQVVLRLQRRVGHPKSTGYECLLKMEGNQLAPKSAPLQLFLSDGVFIAQKRGN